MTQYSHKNFDTANLVLGLVEDDQDPKALTSVDGEVTLIEYELPEDMSLRQAALSYQAALPKAGFRSLVNCRPVATCGEMAEDLINARVIPQGYAFKFLGVSGQRDQEFLQIHRGKYQGADTYVLLLGMQTSNPDIRDSVYQQIVSVKEAASVMSVNTAAQLASELGSSGAAVVGGIYFDTDRSIVKPESRPALEQIASLLRKDNKVRLYIVGHTDDAGDYVHNQTLSEARAKAVRDSLIQQFKIDASRLDAHGVGSLAPVASNRSDAGRASNRRVMIVERR